jgi:hypothetical protein
MLGFEETLFVLGMIIAAVASAVLLISFTGGETSYITFGVGAIYFVVTFVGYLRLHHDEDMPY